MMPSRLTVSFDGACTRNPGGTATYGYLITCDETGAVVATDSGTVTGSAYTSSNVGEWAGLRAALRSLRSGEWRGALTIRGDSQLVISQLSGAWQCKKEHLKPYLVECRALLDGCQWTAEWVPRSQNRQADSLSRSPDRP